MRLMKLNFFAHHRFTDPDRFNINHLSELGFRDDGDDERAIEFSNFQHAYINPDQIICVSNIDSRFIKISEGKYKWMYAFYIEMFNGDVFWVRCNRNNYNQINKFLDEGQTIQKTSSNKSRK